jgi:hypothetical protein
MLRTHVLGFAASSRSTDMYAFAILCWEVLTERIPFNNNPNFAELMLKGERPDDSLYPQHTPRIIKEMIKACWNDNREKRKTAVECFTILSQCRESFMLFNHETNDDVEIGFYDIHFLSPVSDSNCSLFLSYLYNVLNNYGYRIWFQQKEIGASCGSEIDNYKFSASVLPRILSNSTAVFVFIDGSSLYSSSDATIKELEFAISLNKYILFLLLENPFAVSEDKLKTVIQRTYGLKDNCFPVLDISTALSCCAVDSSGAVTDINALKTTIQPVFHHLLSISCMPSNTGRPDSPAVVETVISGTKSEVIALTFLHVRSPVLTWLLSAGFSMRLHILRGHCSVGYNLLSSSSCSRIVSC